jgi:hypothetical protein
MSLLKPTNPAELGRHFDIALGKPRERVFVGINASNQVLLADLEEEDRSVPGVYRVLVPADLAPPQRASAALDVFHSKIGIGVPEDFSFTPYDIESNAALIETADHEAHSTSMPSDIEKVSDTPLSLFDVKVTCEGAQGVCEMGDVRVLATHVSEAESLALAILGDTRSGTAGVSPRYSIQELEAPAAPELATIQINLAVTYDVRGEEAESLRSAIENNLNRAVDRGLLDCNNAASVEEYAFTVVLQDAASADLSTPDVPAVMNQETYWLYYNGNPIYSVRMPAGSEAEAVRTTAIMQHDRVPLCYPMAPGHFRAMLYHAEIRQFELPMVRADDQLVAAGAARERQR